MSEQTKNDKQAKRDARRLMEQANSAFERGDYSFVRKICQEVIALAPNTEWSQKAERQNQNLSLDRMILGMGLVAMLVYITTWFLVLR